MALCLSGGGEVKVSAGASCTLSSLRYKENVVLLNNGLETVRRLTPHIFNYKGIEGERIGFIAEEIDMIDPRLVVRNSEGGIESVRYEEMSVVLTKAMQELDARLLVIEGSSTPATLSDDTTSDNFLQNLFGKFTEWFASAANGIGDFVANRVRTKELCIFDDSGETCITKMELDSLLAGTGVSGAPSGGGSIGGGSDGSGNESATTTDEGETTVPPADDDTEQATTTDVTPPEVTDVEPPAVSDAEPPIVMPLGANPTTVNKGDTYIDPGVTVSDNVDQGLSYTVSVDGLAPTDPSSLSLDTTTLVAHTLTFSATDNAGNVGIATRTVQVVESVLAPPEPSPEP